MKNTKKFLSLLIVMVMLFASLPFASVSAADGYTLTLNAPCVVESSGHIPATIYFTPEEDGVYHFYSTGSYETSATLYDTYATEVEYNDDGKDGYNFGLSAYLTEGKTYILEVWATFEDDMVVFPVVAEKPVALTYPVEIPYEEYQYLTFTPAKDGFYYIYSVGDADTYGCLYDNEWNDLWDNDDYNSLNFGINYYLFEGVEYYIEIGAYSEEDEKTIICIQNTIVPEYAEIITPPTNKTVIKDLEDETYSLDDTVVEFTMSDGSKYLWSYNEGGLINGCEVDFSSDFDYTGAYCTTFYCEYAQAIFTHKTIDNPVKSIEYLGEPITLYENSNGYTDYDDNDNEYFYYYFSLPDEPCIRINYKDGTNEVASFYDNNLPYFLSWYNNQYTEPWTKGTDNAVTATYLGYEADIPVHILETPVKSIKVNSEPDYAYTFGDDWYGYFDSEGTVYSFYPSEIKGLELFVTYKDGTTETVKGEDLLNGDPYDFEINYIDATGTGTYTGDYKYKGFPFQIEIVVTDEPADDKGIIGDANFDGDVNIKDATLIQKHTANITRIPNTNLFYADVDGNTDINIKDATAIQKFIAGIDVNLPIGEKN